MPLPYSLDLTRLATAYASGALAPSQVVADVLAQVRATKANPVWLDVMPREALRTSFGYPQMSQPTRTPKPAAMPNSAQPAATRCSGR